MGGSVGYRGEDPAPPEPADFGLKLCRSWANKRVHFTDDDDWTLCEVHVAPYRVKGNEEQCKRCAKSYARLLPVSVEGVQPFLATASVGGVS